VATVSRAAPSRHVPRSVGPRYASPPNPPRTRQHPEPDQHDTQEIQRPQEPQASRTSQGPRAGCRNPAGLRRRAAAGRWEPGAGAPTRRADPGQRHRGPARDQPDPTVLASRPRDLAPADGTGDRRAAEPGARSPAGSGGRASAPRSPGSRSRSSRSPGRHSRGSRSSGRRSSPPGSWVRRRQVGRCRVRRCRVRRCRVRRCRVRRCLVGRCLVGRCRVRPWARSRRPGSPVAGGSGPAGVRVGGPAGATGLRVAAAAGRTRRRRRSPRSIPRRCPTGRRGVRPGVFACAGRSHRGPGRCRHVPPGIPPGPCCPARAAGHALSHECRSGEIPGRT
jgi:hypothetical protein